MWLFLSVVSQYRCAHAWVNLAYKIQLFQGLNQPFSLLRIIKDGVSLFYQGLHLPLCDDNLKILCPLDFPDSKWCIWPEFSSITCVWFPVNPSAPSLSVIKRHLRQWLAWLLGWGGTNIFLSCAEMFQPMQSQAMPHCRDRQAGKLEFTGAHFTGTDPSELQLEPGEVEILCVLDVKLVLLVCESLLPGFPAAALFFFKTPWPLRDRTRLSGFGYL